MLICSSPQHFGACPVLLRLLVPRHPPYALIILTRVFLVLFKNLFLVSLFLGTSKIVSRFNLVKLIVFLCLSFVSLFLCSFQGSFGGDEEIRTPDPLLARQVLSQLSYTPTL